MGDPARRPFPLFSSFSFCFFFSVRFDRIARPGKAPWLQLIIAQREGEGQLSE